MRIVSLLPSLTELVSALGHRDALVGVTHECDYPADVARLPHVTRSRIEPTASSAAIDAAVVAQGSLYELDGDLLAQLALDLILTQEQCDVCAPSTRRPYGGSPRGCPPSHTLKASTSTCLAELHAMFRRVGELLGGVESAESLIAQFEATAVTIARRRQGRPVPRVVILEWFDPPFSSGHWNPELVMLAGGVEVLGEAGQRSRRHTWGEVAEADPEFIVLAPCGFTIERTEQELGTLQTRAEWTRLGAVRNGGVTLVDGSAYFSRPGPRLEASLRIAAAAIDLEACSDLAPEAGWRRLPAV